MVSIARWIPKFSLSALVRVGIGLALVACLLADAAGWIEVRALTQLELWAYDARVRLFLPRTRDPRIVIVDIDERSLSAEGHWPWGRDKLALMLHQLFARYGVRVVGFDVAFPRRARTPACRSSKRPPPANCATTRRFKLFCSGCAPRSTTTAASPKRSRRILWSSGSW